MEQIFHPAVAQWFARSFPAATEVQQRAWAVTARHEPALIAAPTGSGKTLAAFLAAINNLVVEGLAHGLADEVYVLYVSPLKALSNDIQKNLQAPLCGIRDALLELGLPDVAIRDGLRTGDTPVAERERQRRNPPHILVTTPESLFILLTSDSGRRMLQRVRSVIVDELHALAGNKRGAHLMLSLERLGALTGTPPVRIGLSATVKPIEAMARFLVGVPPSSATAPCVALPRSSMTSQPSPASAGEGVNPCHLINTGHTRQRDLALELPRSPLDAVMANEVWAETYDRLAQLVEQHRTTLIFVNQRRMAERVARHLGERIGVEHVAAHHGSLSREHRLDAETRLKKGQLKALIATSSLELGIDIGDVDLVCQLGSPHGINAFLQRVGRAGHAVLATPKGRLFPLATQDLLECSALLHAVNRGELDSLCAPHKPLDVLAQQIVAEVACREWAEEELFDRLRCATPYRELTRTEFDSVVRMLADGYTTRRGRRGAYLHHDAVNQILRARRGAKLTAVTNAGVIPDQFNYDVVLQPEGHRVGSLDEDFAFESIPGDIFQLGNTSYRIQKVETGKVFVEDARGQPPTIPFWFGEGAGRSNELSAAVAELCEQAEEVLKCSLLPSGEGASKGRMREHGCSESVPSPGADASASPGGRGKPPSQDGSSSGGKEIALCEWLERDLKLPATGAQQLTQYLACAHAALGALPNRNTVIFERFFDDVGDTHLVIHSPFGSRINKAWGLALRKRFCRQFNFELQASALEDSIVLSLGPTHSFPLEDIQHYLKSASVRGLLIQALLDAPMFGVRWRWNASIALAIKRMNGGKRTPPQFQRADAEDLLTLVFPDQVACAENLVGEREIPDHPLVAQTIDDCLNLTMDIGGLERLLRRLEQGELRVVTRDLAGPSPLSGAILSARPYAFLDDGDAEGRRTRAVSMQQKLEPQTAADLGRLSPQAIAQVQAEAWPEIGNADELHDALVVHGFLTAEEIGMRPSPAPAGHPLPKGEGFSASPSGRGRHEVPGEGARHPWLTQLIEAQRVTSLHRTGGKLVWLAAERLHEFQSAFANSKCTPSIPTVRLAMTADPLKEILRSRLELLGPVTPAALAAPLGLSDGEVQAALLALEAEGAVMRGEFTFCHSERSEESGLGPSEIPHSVRNDNAVEWCERRLLARIHRYTRDARRAEIQTVPPAQFMSFLFRWQGLARSSEDGRREGDPGLLAVLQQLEGYAAPAAAWEEDLLPARVKQYFGFMLDRQCAAGRVAWSRPAEAAEEARRKSGPVRGTPILFAERGTLAHWQTQAAGDAAPLLSGGAQKLLDALRIQGASFLSDLAHDSGLLRTQTEQALGELVAHGLISCDSYAGLRGLITPAERRERLRRAGSGNVEDAGRWALTRRPRPADTGPITLAAPAVEHIARVLLRRYGVVFRKLLEREDQLPPWRELFYVYRRLEARGEIRGGRFVSGFSGEQFALPEAAAALRKTVKGAEPERVSISAADPLNLVGIIVPGEKVPALSGNRILFEDGVALAVQAGGELKFLKDMDEGAQWALRNQLIRKHKPGGYLHEPRSSQ